MMMPAAAQQGDIDAVQILLDKGVTIIIMHILVLQNEFYGCPYRYGQS